jgi:hypothetical protein
MNLTKVLFESSNLFASIVSLLISVENELKMKEMMTVIPRQQRAVTIAKSREGAEE